MATSHSDFECSNNFPYQRNSLYDHKSRLERLKNEIIKMKGDVHEMVVNQKATLDQQEIILCTQLDNIYNEIEHKIHSHLTKLKTLYSSKKILNTNMDDNTELQYIHQKALLPIQSEISHLEKKEFEVPTLILDKKQLLDGGEDKLFCNIRTARSPYSERQIPLWYEVNKGDANDQLAMPGSIALHPTSEDVFVTDYGKNRIQVYNIHGEYKFTISDRQFSVPSYLYLSEKNLYVSCDNQRILKFTLETLSAKKTLNIKCDLKVAGLTMDNDNKQEEVLYVCNKYVKQLLKYKSTNLEIIGVVKLEMALLNNYGHLTDLTIKRENLYTLFTKSLNVFDKNGILLRYVIQPDSTIIGESYHFAIDYKGDILLTENSNNYSAVKVYDDTGTLKCSISHFGNNVGEFVNISGIAVSRMGDVIVSDLKPNNCLQMF